MANMNGTAEGAERTFQANKRTFGTLFEVFGRANRTSLLKGCSCSPLLFVDGCGLSHPPARDSHHPVMLEPWGIEA
jgi:hypothetical protein